MKITGAYDPYTIANGENTRKKPSSVKEYSNYLTPMVGSFC